MFFSYINFHCNMGLYLKVLIFFWHLLCQFRRSKSPTIWINKYWPSKVKEVSTYALITSWMVDHKLNGAGFWRIIFVAWMICSTIIIDTWIKQTFAAQHELYGNSYGGPKADYFWDWLLHHSTGYVTVMITMIKRLCLLIVFVVPCIQQNFRGFHGFKK